VDYPPEPWYGLLSGNFLRISTSESALIPASFNVSIVINFVWIPVMFNPILYSVGSCLTLSDILE
jgi:hypothetical protein